MRYFITVSFLGEFLRKSVSQHSRGWGAVLRTDKYDHVDLWLKLWPAAMFGDISSIMRVYRYN